jgi:hypothetical protein
MLPNNMGTANSAMRCQGAPTVISFAENRFRSFKAVFLSVIKYQFTLYAIFRTQARARLVKAGEK